MGAATTQAPADAGPTRLAVGASAIELALIPGPGLEIRVVENGGELAVLTFGAKAAEVRVTRPGRTDEHVPVSGGRQLRLLLDADLLELFGAGGYGAFRIGVAVDPDAVEILVSAPHPEISLRRL
jgi:hypothetical protein